MMGPEQLMVCIRNQYLGKPPNLIFARAADKSIVK